jgi:hypothetical protein
MSISLTNFINVSLTSTPVGLSDFAVNNIALFTNETPNFVDEYKYYQNATSVGKAFGTDSLTYKMAVNVFSQSPNPLSADGSLIIIPLHSSISATQGSFLTPDISANLDNLIAITNGEFTIHLNGTAIDVTEIDLTKASSIDDVATVIKRKLLNIFIETETNSTSGVEKILFTSKKFGTSSKITFSSVSDGTGTDLTGVNYLNTTGGTATTGTASSGETLVSAITRTNQKVYYDGVLTTLLLEDNVIKTTASTVQSNDELFFYPSFSTEDFTGIAATITGASQTKTRLILYSDSIEDGQLAIAAYAGRGLSVNFSGTNTASTMNLKSLVNVDADSGVDDDVLTNAETVGIDIIAACSSLSVVVSNGANNYFDNVYNDIWLKLALEVAGFNHLRQTNTKVPQTEVGMDSLKGAYRKILKQAVTNGCVAPGTWTSPDTIGDPEDMKRNISDYGYYLYSIPLSQQSTTDRQKRKAPVAQIALKRAGAFHSSDVIVNIND